jgi:hypothetical protein
MNPSLFRLSCKKDNREDFFEKVLYQNLTKKSVLTNINAKITGGGSF